MADGPIDDRSINKKTVHVTLIRSPLSPLEGGENSAVSTLPAIDRLQPSIAPKQGQGKQKNKIHRGKTRHLTQSRAKTRHLIE